MSIVPKRKALGIDFCGTDFTGGYFYLIRSDLNSYMRIENMVDQKGTKYAIHPLHYKCRNGDHYLALSGGTENGYYYIIKGDEYLRTRSLGDVETAETWKLHPNCQGGDHYLGGAGDHKYIIFGDKYRRVTDMTTDNDACVWDLHEECRGGLYYWASDHYKYFLKEDRWGVSYHRVTDLTNNTDHRSWSVHPSVIAYLPGGLATILGDSSGKWVSKGSLRNDSSSEPKYSHVVETKQGYRSSVMQQVQSNWRVTAMAGIEATQEMGDDNAKRTVKEQFSLTSAFGGSQTDTTQEDWSEERTVTQTLEFSLLPGETVHVWQYVMLLGAEAVLKTKHIAWTRDDIAPTNSPLPRSNPMA